MSDWIPWDGTAPAETGECWYWARFEGGIVDPVLCTAGRWYHDGVAIRPSNGNVPTHINTMRLEPPA